MAGSRGGERKAADVSTLPLQDEVDPAAPAAVYGRERRGSYAKASLYGTKSFKGMDACESPGRLAASVGVRTPLIPHLFACSPHERCAGQGGEQAEEHLGAWKQLRQRYRQPARARAALGPPQW